jgi:DNA-binding NarL/FixJ family response regulator
MENIMIIDEKSSFRDGLKRLIELRFGNVFKIIGIEPQKIVKFAKEPPPKLIIIEKVNNITAATYLVEMRKKGTKVVWLSLDPENIQGCSELNLFDGFLLKKMPTQQLLSTLEEIIDHDNVYVHPDIGYHLLKKVIKSEKKEKTTCN